MAGDASAVDYGISPDLDIGTENRFKNVSGRGFAVGIAIEQDVTGDVECVDEMPKDSTSTGITNNIVGNQNCSQPPCCTRHKHIPALRLGTDSGTRGTRIDSVPVIVFHDSGRFTGIGNDIISNDDVPDIRIGNYRTVMVGVENTDSGIDRIINDVIGNRNLFAADGGDALISVTNYITSGYETSGLLVPCLFDEILAARIAVVMERERIVFDMTQVVVKVADIAAEMTVDSITETVHDNVFTKHYPVTVYYTDSHLAGAIDGNAADGNVNAPDEEKNMSVDRLSITARHSFTAENSSGNPQL